MSRRKSAKELVLARYPNARATHFVNKLPGALIHESHFIEIPVLKWQGVSEWEMSEAAAWTDAAKRLRRTR